MSYCRKHMCDNCIECALEKQTKEIVSAINKVLESDKVSDYVGAPFYTPLKDDSFWVDHDGDVSKLKIGYHADMLPHKGLPRFEIVGIDSTENKIKIRPRKDL